jgi:hypothetical protein
MRVCMDTMPLILPWQGRRVPGDPRDAWGKDVDEIGA